MLHSYGISICFINKLLCIQNLEIDRCSPNPCGVNGRCVDGFDNFTCLCKPGYSGARCNEGE